MQLFVAIDMHMVFVYVFPLVLVAAYVALKLSGNNRRKRKNAEEQDYFASRYGSSVERMLEEYRGDRLELLSIRDSGRTGVLKAVMKLRTTDPVPLAIASEFVKRL
ncbi:MAG: hypothetical protein FWG15_02680 [Propionibacteriaceae bacterium]|nr:hypothetical protein [Propionibacteriaceae bacterium]